MAVVDGPNEQLKLPRGVCDHGEVGNTGLRVRSLMDHAWGGRRYMLVHLASGSQLPGQYLSEQGARDAAQVMDDALGPAPDGRKR